MYQIQIVALVILVGDVGVNPKSRPTFPFYAVVRHSHRNSVCSSVRLSVCPFVTRVDQSKTVQVRITKSSPSAACRKTIFMIRKTFFINLKGVTTSETAK